MLIRLNFTKIVVNIKETYSKTVQFMYQKMVQITSSQFHILKNEIQDNVNLKAKLNTILEEVREVVSFEIHDTCKAMAKASKADAELYNDYETLDCEAWTPDYIDLITLDALRDIVNKTIAEEVWNIAKHAED